MSFRFTYVLGVSLCLVSLRLSAQVTWQINNLTNIGGLTVAKYGTPQVTNTLYGDGVIFNGINQGLTLGTNPIAGMTNFTVEMFFRPDPTNTASATQPRMFHIAAPNANQIAPDHRLTLEGRITNNQWYADTFIRYGSASSNMITLSDASKVHPVGQWYYLAVTYDGAQFKQYVNGVQELSGAVSSGPLTNGVCSIGMRANTNNFFQGVVLAMRFTSRVLATNEFLSIAPTNAKSTLALQFDATGAISNLIRLTGAASTKYVLQAADTVTGSWISIGTNTTGAGGIADFTDPAVTNPVRFYRSVLP